MPFAEYLKNITPRWLQQGLLAARALPGWRTRRDMAASYSLPGEYRRIYFYHIRKTAGTSLNHAFFSLSGNSGPGVQELVSTRKGWDAFGGYIFAIHNTYLAHEGNYFYAYSHAPSHQLVLPPATFRITILRDPVARVVSHYRNLVHYRRHNQGLRTMRQEGSWLGDGFDAFVRNCPREHLLRQLYMFSQGFDVGEAAEKISSIEFVGFTETFGADLVRLAQMLDLPLKLHRSKSSYDPVEVTIEQKDRLRGLLEPEYRLLELVKARRR